MSGTIDSPEAITQTLSVYLNVSNLNRINEKEAILPEHTGLRLYDSPPLVGVADAKSPLFQEFRRSGVIGPHFRPPPEWLPSAASVISFFLPFSQKVVESNRLDADWPSAEWLHARVEGQRLINAICRHLAEQLQASGFDATVPSLHPQFASWLRPPHPHHDGTDYSSNWSERHVAHAAGLGTFGLSAALITSLGVAGRFGSVVTSLELPATPLPYQAFDEYCLHCGACARNCRYLAISPAKGKKDKQICSAFLDIALNRYRPRYGCGKCYVNVPCERKNPKSTERHP